MLDIRWDKLFPPGYHPTKKKLFYMKGILIDYDDPEARNRGIFEVGGDISDEEKAFGHLTELGSAVMVLCIFIFVSVLWLSAAYNLAARGMYSRLYPSGEKLLNEGFIAKPMGFCLQGSLRGIWFVVVFCITCALIHYLYFVRSSKSIFVMKRIASPFELHLRCLGFPLLVLAAALMLCALMILIFRAYYFAHIPAQCLPQDTSIDVPGLFRFVSADRSLS